MVTSHDVARLAGVSQPTVSRALRDSPKVSEETKQRVRQAAKALGYVPSETGRALSSGRTRRIGLLLTDLENQFYPHVIAPMHHELDAFGYQLVLQTETSDTATVAERLISNGLDGVLLATTTVDSVVPVRLRDRGVPFVYFNRTADAMEADSATVDPVPGMAEVGRGDRRAGPSTGRRHLRTAQHQHGAAAGDGPARRVGGARAGDRRRLHPPGPLRLRHRLRRRQAVAGRRSASDGDHLRQRRGGPRCPERGPRAGRRTSRTRSRWSASTTCRRRPGPWCG